MSPSPCLAAAAAPPRGDAWDSIWAEFDGRAPSVAPPEVAPAPRPPIRARRRWRGVMALALAMPAAWLTEPTLVAAGLLKGLARQDMGALTERTDWSAVTPTLARDLRAAGGQGHGAGAARFLDIMAGEMAEAWQSPARRDAVLHARTGAGAADLHATRAEAPGRVVLDLGRAGDAAPALSVVLSMTDPARLGWSVTGLRFAEAAGPGAPPPPVAMRPRLVAF
ncbi:hypothetical protein C8P66_105111 [Humitalea rosea]|uniref:DUF2939 family protein n=1 Tax=Humitalea rosea TaxID=990373 RepID=A0A2W7JA92_9PROT|nr:hypothetical protein [Humitalea rosea]PZW48362.1 hypothetical protein C8P66_105111 [Humitalea rosea]